MNKKLIFGICLILSIGSFALAQADDEMTGLALGQTQTLEKGGSKRAEQAVGFYADGNLLNSDQIPNQGPYHVHLFPQRDRGWGTGSLIKTLLDSAREIKKRYPRGERLQVGDIAAHDGGVISGHASHQNGLDADIGYLRTDLKELDPQTSTGFPGDFVIKGGLTPVFDKTRNWQMFASLVRSGLVNRIFVDVAIKAFYCGQRWKDPNAEEVLRRLRPYPNHADHFHLRLNCPASSPRCIPQKEVDPGSGCQELAQQE